MSTDAPLPVLSDQELNYLARGIMYIWQTATRDMGKGTPMEGLQISQFAVLRFLRRGPMRMTELAELTGTSSANVTGMIDRLVERGVVERKNDTKDRRVVLVSLTETGRGLFENQGGLFKQHMGKMLETFTPAEQHELVRLISKIYDAGHPDG